MSLNKIKIDTMKIQFIYSERVQEEENKEIYRDEKQILLGRAEDSQV